MPRQTGETALTAEPRSLAERKAGLDELVAAGKITKRQAALIDLREPTARERDYAETLLPRAHAAHSGRPKIRLRISG
ncbi:MAG TPA: hypothetical protein VEO95_12035 [Chthoniobacteraceae bacterium]|nr:hypothetical protein [Chthoniobacteraceae bacterium]